MKELVAKYYTMLREHGPKLCQSVARLDEPVSKCNIDADLQHVAGIRDSATNFAEQMLPDFYAEHMSNVMNRERRKISLERCLHWVRSDVEKESRARRGVQNLSRALRETPNFGGQESKQEIHDKLLHIRSMLAFFEITRIKLHNAISDLMEPNQISKMDHPLCKYLEVMYHCQCIKSHTRAFLKYLCPYVRMCEKCLPTALAHKKRYSVNRALSYILKKELST